MVDYRSMPWDGQQVDPDQHMIVIRAESDWRAQLTRSWRELEASCEGTGAATLAQMQPHNPAAFSAFVEAYYALWPDKVDDDMIRLAGLVPVDQALG